MSETLAQKVREYAGGLRSQARVYGNPHDGTPAAGVVATLLDVARELDELVSNDG